MSDSDCESDSDTRATPFCAVCGVPFYGFHFAGHVPDDGKDETTEPLSNIGAQGYDASALTLEDAAWILEYEMLVMKPERQSLQKTMWTNTGYEGDIDDLQPPCVALRKLEERFYRTPRPENFFPERAYFDTVHHEPAYPVHDQCRYILQNVLTTASSDLSREPDDSTGDPDLDTLHAVLRTLDTSDWGVDQNVLLGVQYREPLTPHIGPTEFGHWISSPGWEFLLARPGDRYFPGIRTHPSRADQVRTDLKRTLMLPATTADLSARVNSDLFAILPWQLLEEILSLVDNGSLSRLTQASWHVHHVLHDHDEFWQGRLRNHMGWFPELQTYLDDPWPGLTQQPKALFLWAMQATESKQGLRGPYMSIANRRRIWYVCDQIADRYKEMQSRRPTLEDAVATEIRKEAWSIYLPLVAHPFATIVTAPYDAFWLCDWDEMQIEMLLETFWDAEGSLVGMSVAPKAKRRLVGINDSENGVHKVTATIPDVDWISEIVLHFPRLQYLDEEPPIEDTSCITPTGMTVYFVHRPPLEIGDVGPDQCLRLFRPQKGATIVGMQGQVGVVNGHRRIIRFGIIQAPSNSPDWDTYGTTLRKNKLSWTQRYLWAANPPCGDGRRIWDFPTLAMGAYQDCPGPVADNLANVCHDDLVPLDPFIYARTPEERQSMVRLSASQVEVHDGAMPPHMRTVMTRIGSLRVEYDEEYSDLQARQIGGADLAGDVQRFEVDGDGDERIVIARISTWGYGLQLTTNESRVTSWVYDETEEEEYEDYEVLMNQSDAVGVGFVGVLGIDQTSGRSVIRVMGVLQDTMNGEDALDWECENLERAESQWEKDYWEDMAVELPGLDE